MSLFVVAIGAVADFMTVVAPVVHWFLLASLTAVLLSLIVGRLRRPWRALCHHILLYAGMLFLVCLGFFAAQHPSNFWQRLLSIPQAVAGERGALAAHVDQVAALQDIMSILSEMDKKLDLLVAAWSAQNPESLAATNEAGIPRSTIIELARRTLPSIKDGDTEAALRELEYVVEIAIRVAEEDRYGTKLGDFIETVLARVAELSRNGRFDEAGTAAGNAFRAWEREEATRQAEEDERRQRSQTEGIRLLRAHYDVDVLARKPAAAAGRLVQIIDLQHADADARLEALLAEQNARYEEGRDRGVNLPLEIAIYLARVGLGRARNADERGVFGNNLGNVLWALGGRESGKARLKEAVEVLRAVLSERTPERAPLDWASIKNNLGNALAILGERESDTVRFEEAVDAYRAALTERTRELVPLEWAATKDNLGNALTAIGERGGGTAFLKEAVDAHWAALAERTRKRVPLAWAATQNNLGNALRALGERELGTESLKAAVDAYQSALEEIKRGNGSLGWAMIQHNLGAALHALGERDSGVTRLSEAVAAYEAALSERSRERTPFQWALTMQSLAQVKLTLSERTGSLTFRAEALAAVDGALEVFTEGGADLYVEKATDLRKRILATLSR
ncbi:tetratricopeptide repeat protein (plasmid) [Tistrella bauzanensis]|uniref:tetratricopeptide repeat protein n=1 Tax=Tistrella TaxID=171436 RepID=UPI0031F5FBA6